MGSPPCRDRPHRTQSNSSSNYSDSSDHSRSTAPTVYSDRPMVHCYHAAGNEYGDDGRQLFDEPRSSTETYASTIPSEEDLAGEPEYETAQDRPEAFESAAVPATPPGFAELFPSTRRLMVRHDDATVDGNMNLRIDTTVSASGGGKLDVILFHLRMHDLKNRQFSFRRYCRESGREVCHSSRKFIEPKQKRPTIQRSLSNALSSLRLKPDSSAQAHGAAKGHDLEYDSMDDEEDHDVSTSGKRSSNLPIPTNTTRLEFSNYAQIEVKRRGAKSSKRYEYEYWGNRYQWKREVRKDGLFKEVSYHLFTPTSSKAIAHIVPEPLTTSEALDEESKGGWVPPCSMWVSDPSVFGGLTDVGE